MNRSEKKVVNKHILKKEIIYKTPYIATTHMSQKLHHRNLPYHPS